MAIYTETRPDGRVVKVHQDDPLTEEQKIADLNARGASGALAAERSRRKRTGQSGMSEEEYRRLSAEEQRGFGEVRAKNQWNLGEAEMAHADALQEARNGAEWSEQGPDKRVVNIAAARARAMRAFGDSMRTSQETADAYAAATRSPTDASDIRRIEMEKAKTEQDFRNRYSSAKTDEERKKIKDEHSAWVKETGGGRTPREVIEAAYESDLDEARTKVRLGQMSPFEFSSYKNKLTERRDQKLKLEADYNAAEMRAKEAQKAAAEQGRLDRENQMGLTFSAYKAFQRLRDPFLDEDEKASAKEVAAEAASQFAAQFVKENFSNGPADNGTQWGKVDYQVEEVESQNPKTGQKEYGFAITFKDGNGKPVLGPDGQPITKRITESNLENCLTGRFGWKKEDGRFFDAVGVGDGGDSLSMKTGAGFYGGEKSKKLLKQEQSEAEHEADRAWTAESRKQTQKAWAANETARVKAENVERLKNAVYAAKPEDRDAALAALAEVDGEAADRIRKSYQSEAEHEADRAWTAEQRKSIEAARKAEEASREDAKLTRSLTGKLQGYLFDVYDGENTDKDKAEEYNKDLKELEGKDPAAARQIRSMKDGLDKIRKSKENWRRYQQLANQLKEKGGDEAEARRILTEMATLFEGEVNIGQLRQIYLQRSSGGGGESYFLPSSGGGEAGAPNPPHSVDW